MSSLPDTDGWALLGAIRSDPDFDAIPTYFISAQDPSDEPPASDFFVDKRPRRDVGGPPVAVLTGVCRRRC